MQIIVLAVSGGKESWLFEAVEVYRNKINSFCKFEMHSIKASKQPRDKSCKKLLEEEKKILQYLKPTDKVVLFDEKGAELDSYGFSSEFQKIIEQSPARIVFVVGGAFGVSAAIKSRANKTIKLSDFILNHHVALVVVLEQIFRAFTIQKNIPYHNT